MVTVMKRDCLGYNQYWNQGMVCGGLSEDCYGGSGAVWGRIDGGKEWEIVRDVGGLGWNEAVGKGD